MAKKVLAIVGGISRDSLNKKFYRAFKELAPSGYEVDTFDISMLPFFSQDIEKDAPKVVREFKKRIEEADMYLFITPEYNRSMPGVMKNAIDWGSRPEGSNSWKAHKKGAIAGASSGNIGTFGAQSHLRQTMMHLSIELLCQPEFYFNGSKAFDENGNLTEERTKEYIKKFWNSFIEFAR
jgi:chromate reductase